MSAPSIVTIVSSPTFALMLRDLIFSSTFILYSNSSGLKSLSKSTLVWFPSSSTAFISSVSIFKLSAFSVVSAGLFKLITYVL